MTKIKMLVDEVLSNVIEDGQDKGPKHCLKDEVIEVHNNVADTLVTFGRAKYLVEPKAAYNNYTEQPKVEKPKKSKK